MKCINYQSLSSPLLLPHKHQICILQVRRNGYSILVPSTTCRAIPSPIFLAATSPAPGKLPVLLQTSAVCLIAYWVANFVVPEFIMKDFQSKNTDEDGDNPSEDER